MKKLFVVLIALCSCFSLIHAQSPVQTESQVVDAEVLNTVLQGINEMLETIETRLSAIEGKLGVETPAPTKHVYVGMVDGRIAEFPSLTTDALIENARKYTDNISNLSVTKQMLYFLIPEGDEFISSNIESGGVISPITYKDLYNNHADVTYDGITYKVYMIRFGDPEDITFNLNFK